MPNHDAGQFSAADEALANLPRRDPLRTTPDGRPTLRRRALDIPVDEADETGVDADTIRLNARLVNLNVIATTQDGRAVTNLTAEDFAIFDEETKQEIAHFKPTNTPFNLVLLLDLSGSTREKIEAIRKGAWRFVELTSPQDRVAIVTFTRSVHVLCRPTNDRALLKQRIAEMRATDGGTAYYEAMWFTLTEVLAPFQDERNAVVVMTDGVDNSISAAYPAPSRVSFRQMLEAILESGTLVYPIYLDTEEENFRNHWGDGRGLCAGAYATPAGGGCVRRCALCRRTGRGPRRRVPESHCRVAYGVWFGLLPHPSRTQQPVAAGQGNVPASRRHHPYAPWLL